MSKEDSPPTSDDRSKQDTAWAEQWLAEQKKPSRQRNLTPSQRQELADELRFFRRIRRDKTMTVIRTRGR